MLGTPKDSTYNARQLAQRAARLAFVPALALTVAIIGAYYLLEGAGPGAVALATWILVLSFVWYAVWLGSSRPPLRRSANSDGPGQESTSASDDLIRVQSALDDCSDGVLLTDAEGQPVYINSVFGNWFGYQADQVQSIELNGFFGPNTDTGATLELVLDGEPLSREVEMTTANGRHFPALVRGSTILDQNLKVVGARFIYTNTSRQKRLEAELRQLARQDGLTGINNRAAFDEKIQQEWSRARREHAPLSLLIVDIDDFRSYNDHYGHQDGDTCLRRVAATIAETFKRPGDFVARFGGEEFVVIVAGADVAAVAAQAERLRAHIEYLAIPHERSTAGMHVTISLGLATKCPDGTNNPEGMIEVAERALYRAKETGRNRLCQESVLY